MNEYYFDVFEQVDDELKPRRKKFNVGSFVSGDVRTLEERQIGIDYTGKPLYEKIVLVNSLPNNTTGSYAHGIENGERIRISLDSFWSQDEGVNAPIPHIAYGNSVMDIQAVIRGDNIEIRTGTNRPNAHAEFVLHYSKTTD